MTDMDCCDAKIYSEAFDRKLAIEELDDYRNNGPKNNSKPLINFLRQLTLENASLLDVGSGVGAIIFELFKHGISRAIYCDFSASYHAVFQEEVKNRALEKVTESFVGNFLEMAHQIEKVDLVTLDKVICCYENYEVLVRISLQKASKWYAYSLPRDVWWVKLVHVVTERIKRLKGDTFRTFVHPARKIENMVLQHGFKKIHDSSKREWQTVIFEKNDQSSNLQIV